MKVIILVLYGINLILFLLALLWILVPAFYGLPSKPTKPDRIRKALQLADLKPGEVLYDLGAGDGRVLLIAVREFDAKAIGIEIGPVQCALIHLRAAVSGFGNKIQIKWGSYFKANLKDADVIFIYATSKEIPRLAPRLKGQMKPGSRLVSISADFPEWEPVIFDNHDLLFIYAMPPKPGSLTTYLLEKSK